MSLPKPYYDDGKGIVIYCGDCREILPLLEPVDLVCTSPPYDDLRDYGGHELNVEGCLLPIANAVKEGGVIMWNVSDACIDGSETGTSFKQVLRFMDCGLKLHDTMVYLKEGVNFPSTNRYHQAFEYMFILSNGNPMVFNAIADRPNKLAGDKMHGTDRNKDGTTTPKHSSRVVPAFGNRYNWWLMKNQGNTGHPAPMPYEMASGHILTWTNEAQTILDPFMGSGTTLVAAKNLGRRCIGIE